MYKNKNKSEIDSQENETIEPNIMELEFAGWTKKIQFSNIIDLGQL